MEARNKDGEKERAEDKQDAGREEDDMTGDGKWNGMEMERLERRRGQK